MKNFVIAASLMLALGACATPHSKQVREDAHDRYDRANAQVVFDQANQSFHAGQFEAALGHIDKAITRYPKDGNYEVMRGRILLEMKRTDMAREAFVKAAALSPTCADPHYYMGIVLQRWNELDKAAAEYAKAFELAPSQLQYVAAECETLIAAGRLNDAEKITGRTKTFEFSPVLDRIHADLAGQRGDLKERERWLTAARLRTEPAKAQQLVEEIAVTRFEQGNWVGCIDALEDEALKDSAKSTELVRLRARCLLMMDRARDARDLMLTLRTQTDGDGRNASVLGLAAMRIGDTARMIDAGHVLTQARPDSADGWVLLGVAAMQNGDRAEAVRLLSEANKREPNKKLPKQLLAAASSVAIARATP